MIKKKAQVTFFVIVAILIAVAIVFIYFFRGSLTNSEIPSEMRPAYDHIINCIKVVGDNATFELARNGGYAIYSGQSLAEGDVTSFLLDNKNIMPSINMLNFQFSVYMKQNLPFCFDKLKDYNLSYSSLNLTLTINKDDIIYNLISPIIVLNGDSAFEIKEFNDIKVPTRFKVLFDSSKQIVDWQISKKTLCLTCVDALAKENGLKIDFASTPSGNATFVFVKDISQLNNESLQMIFAIENE